MIATHFIIEPCEWFNSKPEYGLQLFHVQAGSQWTVHHEPAQNKNFTTQWIPLGEVGYDANPNTGCGNKIPLSGWRFYPITGGGSRVEAKP